MSPAARAALVRARDRLACWPTSTVYVALVLTGASGPVLDELYHALGVLLDLQGAEGAEEIDALLCCSAPTIPAPPPSGCWEVAL